MQCKNKLIELRERLNTSLKNINNIINRLPNMGEGLIIMNYNFKPTIDSIKNLLSKVYDDLNFKFSINDRFNLNELINILKADNNNLQRIQYTKKQLLFVLNGDWTKIKQLVIELKDNCNITYNIDKLTLEFNNLISEIEKDIISDE